MSIQKKIKRGICKLCNIEKDLIRSHIVPDAFYRVIKEENGGVFLNINNDPKSKNQVAQTGVWEHLLCSYCDNILGIYDNYALDFCKKYWGITIINEKAIKAKYVNYKYIRMFQISLLWRAMISSRREFQSAKFNQKHEQRLKEMILKKDVSKYYEYGCFMYLNVDEGKVLKYAFQTPTKYTYNGFNGIYFTFGGFTWSFLVNSNMQDFPYNNYLLQDGQDLIITIVPFYKLKSTLSLMKQLKEQGKLEAMKEYFDKHP